MRGFPVEPVRRFDGTEDDRTVVVEFPCEFDPDSIFAKNMSAVRQMDIQRTLQRVWSDNAVSTTVYYAKEELPEIQDYLREHWAEMKSISFLLREDHGFDQAPLEEITREEYLDRLKSLKEVGHFHTHGTSELLDGEECATGACPIR
jgi:hypothetical protein